VSATFTDDFVTIYHGDAWALAQTLEPQSVHTIVTSPPYWGQRDYGVEGQAGLEPTLCEHIYALVLLFRALRPALCDDGTLWVNLGDRYVDKHLLGYPWRVAFALQRDGWMLRSDNIWSKPNPMPESVSDRPTRAHEYVFLFSKGPKYHYDGDAIREPPAPKTLTTFGTSPKAQGNDALGGVKSDNWGRTVKERKQKMKVPSGWDTAPGSHSGIHREGRTQVPEYTDKQRGHSRRHQGFNERWDAMSRDEQMFAGGNKRTVWTVAPAATPFAHFAVFPPDLIRPCILAGCPEGGTVLDPFMGSGTTAQVARSLSRKAIGFELNAEYIDIAAKHRLAQGVLL